MSKNLFYLYKNLNLEFTLFITCMVIDFPQSVSSRMQPKYVNFVYCLIFISLYWIFKRLAFLILRLLLKTIYLVLSSPKWRLILLPTNQSNIKLKFLLRWIVKIQFIVYCYSKKLNCWEIQFSHFQCSFFV